MPRTIFTEQDIEDLARRGIKEIELSDEVTITDLARDRMNALGLRARTVNRGSAALAGNDGGERMSDAERQQVFEKIKQGVLAKLGPGADVGLVEKLVRRVVDKLP